MLGRVVKIGVHGKDIAQFKVQPSLLLHLPDESVPNVLGILHVAAGDAPGAAIAANAAAQQYLSVPDQNSGDADCGVLEKDEAAGRAFGSVDVLGFLEGQVSAAFGAMLVSQGVSPPLSFV